MGEFFGNPIGLYNVEDKMHRGIIYDVGLARVGICTRMIDDFIKLFQTCNSEIVPSSAPCEGFCASGYQSRREALPAGRTSI